MCRCEGPNINNDSRSDLIPKCKVPVPTLEPILTTRLHNQPHAVDPKMGEFVFKYLNQFLDPWDEVKLAGEDMTVFVPLDKFSVEQCANWELFLRVQCIPFTN